jgi:hypothetical protein
LLGQIAVRLRLISIAEPILARDRHIQNSRTQVKKRDVKPTSIKRDDVLIMFGHIPECGQQFDLVHAGHKFDRTRFTWIILVIFRREEDLATGGFRIEHRDADHLSGEGPQVELLLDLAPPGVPGCALGELFQFTEKILLLGVIETVQRKGRSLDVKHESGHNEENLIRS